jgi:hypothetical protein
VGAWLIPVAVRPVVAEQAIDENAGARALIAVDHDAGGIGERGLYRFLDASPFEAIVAFAIDDALHAAPARHQLEAIGKERRVVGLAVVVEQVDRREIALAAPGGSEAAEAADRDRAHDNPSRASCAVTRSSPMQWLPTITRSGTRTCGVNSVTSACVPAGIWSASASIFRNPSDCENDVIAPEPLPVG